MHISCKWERKWEPKFQEGMGVTFLERLGVKHIVGGWPTDPERDIFAKLSLDKILSMKDEYAKHNIIFDGLEEGIPIFKETIFDPEKGDKLIDLFCDDIRIAAKAGMRVIAMDLKESVNQRTGSTVGCGGNRYSSWDMKESLAKNPKNFYDFVISADQNWERITHYLERVIPVATEYKVQIACHPCDPWLPPGFRGVDRVLSNFEGFKRYIEICPSPYHGLQFCLGCMAESCDDPANEVYDIVQYFAERNKIFDIHYRNIIGGRNKFAEVYPDEGVVNVHRVMQILRDTQYPYGITYDHTPRHEDDPGSWQAAAFQTGYIQALIQAVNDEV